MKNKPVLAGLVMLFAIVIINASLFYNNIKESSGQKWEYAQAYYFKDMHLVRIFLQDDIELALINETLTEVKDDELQSVVILDIFGNYDWELVDIDNSLNAEESLSLQIFTFKRLI